MEGYNELQLKSTTLLVVHAHMTAVSTYMPLLKRFPDLGIIYKSNLSEKFDFLLTISSVSLAFSRMTEFINENEIDGYSSATKQALENWENGCSTIFFEFSYKIFTLLRDNVIQNTDQYKEAIGAWIMTKLVEDNNDNIELKGLCNRRELLLSIGNNPFEAFINYWGEIKNLTNDV